jgi:hypothetical protein
MGAGDIDEELASNSLATIAVQDLSATQDIVLVTRRGGCLSAAGLNPAGSATPRL